MSPEARYDREAPAPNEAQERALRAACERYRVEYRAEHYFVYPDDSSMCPGWAEGWLGGTEIQATDSTIYVGVSPEGDIHS